MVVRGIAVSVSGTLILLLAAAYLFAELELFALVLIAVSVHETGHYIAVRLGGGYVAAVKLGAMGVTMHTEGLTGYIHELAAASAGPAASAVLTAAASLFARHFNFEPAYRLAGLSLIFCLFNLLPVLPLDGGRVLYAAVARTKGLRAAEYVSCAASCVVILSALCAGVYLLFVTKRNFTLLAAAVWMLIYYCKNGNNGLY